VKGSKALLKNTLIIKKHSIGKGNHILNSVIPRSWDERRIMENFEGMCTVPIYMDQFVYC
jgi:hypothetical protein